MINFALEFQTYINMTQTKKPFKDWDFSDFDFAKQKTAYAMNLCDWSSDVCSSDLPQLPSSREEGQGWWA